MNIGCTSDNQPAITVGIPCFNEEQSIRQTITSVLAQQEVPDLEILVCINGCTDKTEEIVQGMARKDHRIRLVRSDRGKPNAWNRIRESASSRYIFFIDGDVILAGRAAAELFSTLRQNRAAIAVASNALVLNPPWDVLAWGITGSLAAAQSAQLCGAGYLVDNVGLTRRMRKSGFERMPQNIVCEDLWLTQIIGRELIVACFQANIFYLAPSSPADYFKACIRSSVGKRQIQKEYPLIAPVPGHNCLTWLRAKTARWTTLDKLEKKLAYPLVLLVRFSIRHLCLLPGWILYHCNSYSNRWSPLVTTKNGNLLMELLNSRDASGSRG